MDMFIFPPPGQGLAPELQQKLKTAFFTNDRYDARRWRNKNLPHIKKILGDLAGKTLAEQVFEAIHGRSNCLVCGASVRLGSFSVGWERFCSRGCAQRHPMVRDKAKRTCLERHGGKTIWEIPGNKAKIAKKISAGRRRRLRPAILQVLGARGIQAVENLERIQLVHSCGHAWSVKTLRRGISCPRCASSRPEEEIIKLIMELLPTARIKQRDRTAIGPKEIDILVNDKFGIEYNGAYWHQNRSAADAQRKVLLARERGIRLFTILESDWAQRKDKIVARLVAYLTRPKQLSARALTIRAVDSAEARSFLERHHSSGAAPARQAIGLFTKTGELRQLATFSPVRFSRNKQDWELIRFCSLPGYQVRGGLSRLIAAWRRLHPATKLISYHDLRFGWSDALAKVGFSMRAVTKPGYRWVKKGESLERYQTQKRHLQKILRGVDLSKTEVELMQLDGWIQEFNPGCARWELEA